MDINKLKSEIESNGYAELDSFITENELSILRNLVNEELTKNNNQYFFLSTKNSDNKVLNDKEFLKKNEILLKKLTEVYKFHIRESEETYKVLRVVTGFKSKKVSLDYHFDAHLLTLLVPIYIPDREGSNNGHLIIFKNFRSITKSLFKNIFQKIFYQSTFFKKLFINTGFVKGQILKLKPGNIYIFNGFRTLHTNLNIDPKDIRATLLVHYHDIFKDSYLVKKNRENRNKKEIQNLKDNQSTI